METYEKLEFIKQAQVLLDIAFGKLAEVNAYDPSPVGPRALKLLVELLGIGGYPGQASLDAWLTDIAKATANEGPEISKFTPVITKAKSDQRINELVKEAKQAVADFRNTHPQWYGDDPDDATREAVDTYLSDQGSFLDLVTSDPVLATQETTFDCWSLSFEDIAWAIVRDEVLKRMQEE